MLYGIFLYSRRKQEQAPDAPTMQAIRQIDWKTALLIGCFQVLALILVLPRSGATILGGIVLGMTRKTASEYTFFLAVPVMLGASLLKLFPFGFHFQGMEAI